MSKTYVVTACNRGLGVEFVRQLATRDARIIATARKPEDAATARQLGADVRALDIAEPDSVAAFAAGIAGEPIDVLINNAGVGVGSRPLDELDFAEMEHFFRVNTVGTLRLTRALLPGLRAAAGKKIVNITSRMGSIGDNTGGAAYSYRASKAALNMVTRSLAVDLAPEGFVSVVLHPGWVVTDMGGAGAPVQPEDSVAGMLGVIDRLSGADNGAFYDFTGAVVPW